ncbi:YihY/virulence factor BrkB family protein [Allohahella sp. A8]|uniref:YihY/virulence factor BrkB family protein n=1 Tax=Allohahella sp. A8 TaxID=3141461 RepID=UPI000C0954BD|nr:ribonuclease BN [Hahellaceae bacterium]|tara:strand:- start:10623 stop:11579 length:957 start_codon:yes stop_codon:yes gene_type:complete
MKTPRFANYLKETFSDWLADDAFQKSAALAYYSIFSIPGLVIIVITLASLVWSPQYVNQVVAEQIANTVGPEAGQQIATMVENSRKETNSLLAMIAGIATLVFGASGVFSQLQKSINAVWGVEVDPSAGFKQMALGRITAFSIVLVIAFLMIVSLMMSAALALLNGWIESQLPGFPTVIFFLLNNLLSIAVLTIFFALMFKVLPDAKVQWRSVWLGALLTSVLFTLGKFLLGFYFGKSDPEAAFGAAGSIILVMLWVYYTSLILLFGAEFTQVFARNNGHGVQPARHARHDAAYRLQALKTAAAQQDNATVKKLADDL